MDAKDAKLRSHLAASDIVNIAKIELHIHSDNAFLNDNDIRSICRWIGSRAPDTVDSDSDLSFGKIGIDIMLFVSLNAFPWFYEKYELYQSN